MCVSVKVSESNPKLSKSNSFLVPDLDFGIPFGVCVCMSKRQVKSSAKWPKIGPYIPFPGVMSQSEQRSYLNGPITMQDLFANPKNPKHDTNIPKVTFY